MKTFKINRYIELRLENNQTIIYVNNKQFNQCKYILLNIPKIENYERDYVSIDELKNQYSNKNESNKEIEGLTPEVEFFAHCSNLQAWIQENYNPNVLHSNLSIPLLKELINYDVRVLNALLYHLDEYWYAYESEYDKRYTIERRLLLIEQYKEIIYNALEIYDLNSYELLSNFIVQCRLIDSLERSYPSLDFCDICEKKHKKNEIEFYDYEVFSDTNNNIPDDVYHVCQKCTDEGFPYESQIEYCNGCYKHFHTSYYEQTYGILDDELYCINCYRENILDEGYNYYEHSVRNYIFIFSLDELKKNNWKYTITHYSETEVDESLDYIKTIESKYLVVNEKQGYYTINEYSIYIK